MRIKGIKVPSGWKGVLPVAVLFALLGCAPAPEREWLEIPAEGLALSPSDEARLTRATLESRLFRDCNRNGIFDLSEVRNQFLALDPAGAYATGDNASSVAAGDFDADGDQDLAVLNQDADTVSILLNSGEGVFSAHPLAPPVGESPIAMASADMDADGDDDLVVANYIDDSVSILRSNGDGSFRGAVTYEDAGPIELRDPTRLVAADLDGDGAAEVLVSVQIGSSLYVVLMWNAGDGRLEDPVAYANASSAALVDLDRDGDRDLVLGKSGGEVSLLENAGARTLGPSTRSYDVPGLVRAADMTGDGRYELVTGNDPVRVWRREGEWWDHTGSFSELSELETGVASILADSIALADLDNDGLNDVAAAASGELRIYLNKGAGRFESARVLDAGGHATALAVGDLDGRGPPDLALANGFANRVSVALNASRVSRDANANGVPDWCDLDSGHSNDCNANGVPDEADVRPVVSFSPRGFGVARSPFGYDGILTALDIEMDGDVDVVAGNAFTQEGLLYHFNQGASTFVSTDDPASWFSMYAALDGVQAVSVDADHLDENGRPDLAVAWNDPDDLMAGEVRIYRQNTTMGGTSVWEGPARVEMGERLGRVRTLDLDGDGTSEIIVLPYYWAGAITILRNDAGTFEVAGTIALEDLTHTSVESPTDVTLADMDDDGMNDLVFSLATVGEVSICKNSGVGFVYAPCTAFDAGTLPVTVRAGDLDGDSLADLVVANDLTGHVSALENRSDLAMVPHTVNVGAAMELSLGNYARMYPKAVVAHDFDDRAGADIAAASWFSNNVSVLVNAGDYTFEDALIFPAGWRPEAMIEADVDADGAGDLVVGNGNGELTVLVNRSRAPVSTDVDGDGVPDECAAP